MDTKEMRKDLLKMALAAKSQGAHMGGSLSLVEIMAALYGGTMSFAPDAPQAEYRDRLILSKGHGVMAQYAALKQVGLLSEDELLTYKANGSYVSAHPSVNLVWESTLRVAVWGRGFPKGSALRWLCIKKVMKVHVSSLFSAMVSVTKVRFGKLP